jgi:glycosyltransferase involved in cell wall biosynthesis
MALERQVCSFPWEVIVIDNGSTDTSAATAQTFVDRLPNFRLLSEKTPGKSRALNLGIAAARGEHLIFVDADDEAGEGYVQKMSEALDDFDVVGGYLDTKLLNAYCAQDEMVTNVGLPVYHRFRPGFPGCIFAIRSSVREQVGWYDETLKLAEDVDFCWRAHGLGATFGRQLEAVMHVRRPPTNLAAFRKSRSYGWSAVWLYERYRSQGMERRRIRNVLGPMRWVLARARRNEGPWKWGLSWEIGTIVGRTGESIRRRVFFP